MDGGKHVRWDCNFFGRLIWSYNWLILILINSWAYHQNNISISWFQWSTWISTADNLCRKFEVEAGRAGNINGVIHTNKGQLPPAFRYRGIHEKSSGDVVSAVCYTTMSFRFVCRTSDISALSRSLDSAKIYISCSVHICDRHSI